jgi:vitamin B12 transporter
LGWQPSPALRLTATYADLDATEPGGLGGAQLREVRRPRQSGSVAADGESGRVSYGLKIAYTGARRDTD